MEQEWKHATGLTHPIVGHTLTLMTAVQPQGRTKASNAFIPCIMVFNGLWPNTETNYTHKSELQTPRPICTAALPPPYKKVERIRFPFSSFREKGIKKSEVQLAQTDMRKQLSNLGPRPTQTQLQQKQTSGSLRVQRPATFSIIFHIA